ncbi:type II secretion system protein [Allohahella marinimesophila]|uniref:MSHA pilin protein MshA n=1 Tax=Allohahella marinimesophila TaxID=1054972 RepID=A0ABP7NWS2_9GAMM
MKSVPMNTPFNAMPSNAKGAQAGFTLIELVMVIVILGILAAFALPRFADLSQNANAAVYDGAVGAARSAMAITHAQALVEGKASEAPGTDANITLEGQPITMAYGYPDRAGLATAAQFQGESIQYNATNGTITVGTCVATYTAATSATVPATLVAAAKSADNKC